MQHVKYDLGQVKRGSTVVVTLDKQANVLLMDWILRLLRAGVPLGGEPVFRGSVGHVDGMGCHGAGAAAWAAPALWLLQVSEVFAQGVVTVQDGGVRVGGDPVDDGVGEDLLFHPVVPLARW